MNTHISPLIYVATCSSHTSALIKYTISRPQPESDKQKKLTKFLSCVSELIKKYSPLYDLAL